jgi:hypothetical protein
MTHTTTNTHQVEVDTRIAEAHNVYAKATQTPPGTTSTSVHSTTAQPRPVRRTGTRRRPARTRRSERRVRGLVAFFLVNASNGHIQRTLNCSTCFPTTSYSWLPALSGLTEAEAVAEYGGILCSICFPSAPVEWTTGKNKKDAERKAAEAALKAVAKTKEGKAVIKHSYDVLSAQRHLESLERRIDMALPLRTEKYDYALDAKVPCTAEDIAEQQARIDATQAEITTMAKQAKSQAKLDVATAALNAALGI